jgi:hypothetical protein
VWNDYISEVIALQERKMPAWRTGLLTAALLCGASGAAFAQVGGVNMGLNSNNGAISGGDINRVNGINANGTPRQQDPGASMTNGAGTSAMTPNVTGGSNGSAGMIGGVPKAIPPQIITHGTVNQSGSTP